MVQVPVPLKVAVEPETVQTEAVREAKLTVRPELADALRASGVPCTWLAIGLKVIVCGVSGFAVTVKLCDTDVAAA